MNCLALSNLFNDFPISGNGYQFLIVKLLRPRYLTHNWKEPSNFRSKNIEAPIGDLDGLMNPLAKLVLM